MNLKKILIGITGIIIISSIGFALFFARVIPRTTPSTGIVSPASGKVIALFDSNNPTIVFEKQGVTNTVSLPEFTTPVHVVLIELNLGDVHVQRAPLSGTITRMEHFDGDHINALGKDKTTIAATNEKVVTLFKSDTTLVGVVQVAGRAARRIRNSLSTGSPVHTGEVYGRILLGSQVVLIIPQEIPLAISVGDRVTDGETVIANNSLR